MLMRITFLICLLFASFISYCQTYNLPPVVWERKLGGSSGENANDLVVLSNGDIAAVGRSNSNDGDVSGHHGATPTADGWVVRLDRSGNLLWQKSLGGTAVDDLYKIIATPDNGFLCFGTSWSADMDLPGNNGSADAWIIKLSADGNIEWSRNYGNAAQNSCTSACLMDDGNIAATMETINDVFPYNQTTVMKLDPNGNVLWQVVAANGTGISIAETDDHKLLTSSGVILDAASGAMSAVVWNITGGVFLLKKINGILYAATGAEPNSDDYLVGTLERTGNNMYTFVGKKWATGYSSSDYATGYDPKGLAYLSSSDSYVVSGYMVTYSRGGTFEYGILSTEGVPAFLRYNDVQVLYAVAALNNGDEFVCAGRGFDSTLRYSFWIVKYSIRNVIRGNAFLDLNNNHIQDAGEQVFNNLPVKTSRNGLDVVNKTVNGSYSNFVGEGTFTTSPVLDGLPYYSVYPASDTSRFTGYQNKDTINFAVHAIADAKDYYVSVSAFTLARPGFHSTYQLTYGNRGTDTLSDKKLRFIKDNRLDLLQTTPLFDEISGDTLTWNVDNIAPGSEGHIRVDMIVGGTNPVVIGNTLSSYLLIDDEGDVHPEDNRDSILQPVTGSFDPNDKSEIHGDYIARREVETGKYLQYSIRFQNTGNDTAFTIMVRDTLQPMLDAASFEMISASHPYTLTIKDGRQLAWRFDDILLVDSNRNEPASHGYITYRVKAKNDLAIGDIISNTASIYFDFNAPVRTNTQKTLVVKSTAVWTGAVSPAWEDDNNWNIGVVPDAETVVIIPAGVAHYPVISSAAACYVLRADKNAAITVNEGYQLIITGK